MRYDDPKLRELLAGEYVLGVMPLLARARFERLLQSDDALAREVAAWEERFSPLDATTEAMVPPEHVWRAIERRVAAPAAAPPPFSIANLLESLGLWRGLAAASAAAAVILLAVMVFRPTPEARVVAVLADQSGTPAFIATESGRSGQISVAPVRTQALAAQKSFELWVIKAGTPSPLGLVPATLGDQLQIAATTISGDDLVLAISLEPAGGSPNTGPTGPVLFQGKVLGASR
jgi:anti-sigma-K factor RskA